MYYEQMLLFPELLEWDKQQKLKKLQERSEQFQAQLKKARRSFSVEELKFQQAQEAWKKNIHDSKAWNQMFYSIHHACFNCINKKLHKKVLRKELTNEDVEAKSIDITINICNNIRNKRQNGEFWEILKLGTFVHLPCMAIYDEQTKFEDHIMPEDVFMYWNDGQFKMKETIDSEYKDGLFIL